MPGLIVEPGAGDDIRIIPLEHGAEKKTKMGAIIEAADLDNLSETDFQTIKRAIYEHTLVVLKNQAHVKPMSHYNFVQRFDPNAVGVHGHGTMETVQKTWKGKPTLLAAYSTYNIPEAPGVRLIAAGYQGPDHYGLKDVNFRASTALATHANPPTAEDIEAGSSRWGRWHIDSALYDREPPLITALRCLKLPGGGEKTQTIKWDDGTGTEMEVPVGRTAYFSGEELYEMLTPEEVAIVTHSRVLYAPEPYRWIANCKQDSIGLSIPLGQGQECPVDELPPWTEDRLKNYPMVWTNPVTGRKALQVHAICAWKLFIRSSPDGPERVMEDVDEIRKFLFGLQRRILEPANILIAPYEEGDIAVWNNRACMHTFYEYPESWGPRTMHQVNVAASFPPE